MTHERLCRRLFDVAMHFAERSGTRTRSVADDDMLDVRVDDDPLPPELAIDFAMAEAASHTSAGEVEDVDAVDDDRERTAELAHAAL